MRRIVSLESGIDSSRISISDLSESIAERESCKASEFFMERSLSCSKAPKGRADISISVSLLKELVRQKEMLKISLTTLSHYNIIIIQQIIVIFNIYNYKKLKKIEKRY